jgi:hypothetical protein
VREETGLELRGIRFVMVQDCVDSQEFRWVTHAEAAVMDLNMPTRVLLDRCV